MSGLLLALLARPAKATPVSVFTASPNPAAPAPVPGELVLLQGNAGHHFGHLSHYSEPIMNFASVPYALLHPTDCAELGVQSGDWITVSNGRGKIEVTVRPSPVIVRGATFVPVHDPAANPLNHPKCD